MAEGSEDAGASTDVVVLSESECFELLGVATVGRIGFVTPESIEILPLVYRLGADHRLFMTTSRSGVVARLAATASIVAFEVDFHAEDFGRAWSVLMNGTVSLLDSAATGAFEALRRPPVPWPELVDTIPVQFRPRTIAGRVLLHQHTPLVS